MSGGPGNELPYVTNLPTYAATAYYHHMLPQPQADLETFLRRVEDFASSEYLMALFKGDSLPADQQEAMAEKLHQYTGLSTDYLKHSHLRIDQARFRKELLRDRGLVMAIYDTRYTGKDFDEAGEQVENDPFFFGIPGPFVATLNNYLSAELNVKIEQPYAVFSDEAAMGWKRAGSGNSVFAGFLNTAPYLAQAAATNKDFGIFVASGLLEVQPGLVTVLADTAIRGHDLDEARALESRKAAQEAMTNRASAMDYGRAQAELAEAAAQLAAIDRLRKRRH